MSAAAAASRAAASAPASPRTGTNLHSAATCRNMQAFAAGQGPVTSVRGPLTATSVSLEGLGIIDFLLGGSRTGTVLDIAGVGIDFGLNIYDGNSVGRSAFNAGSTWVARTLGGVVGGFLTGGHPLGVIAGAQITGRAWGRVINPSPIAPLFSGCCNFFCNMHWPTPEEAQRWGWDMSAFPASIP